MMTAPEAGVRYLFIVARKNPDILARVQDRLHGDHRIEVIADRRHGERRRVAAPHLPERRAAERRRPTNVWNDLTIYPTLVAQRHVDSYAELEQKLASASRQTQTLTAETERQRESIRGLEGRLEALVAENARLRNEIAELQRRLHAMASADAEFKAEVGALLAQAEQALGALIARFQRIMPEGRQSPTEPRLRSF